MDRAKALLFSLGYGESEYAAILRGVSDMSINIAALSQAAQESKNNAATLLTYNAKCCTLDTVSEGGNTR